MVQGDKKQTFARASIKKQKGWHHLTNNVQKRLEKHNKGQIKSTKHRTPFELIYTERYTTRREAMFREWILKSVSGIGEKKRILASLGL